MLLDVPLDCLELFTMFLQITFGDVPLLQDVNMCIKLLKSDKESGVPAQVRISLCLHVYLCLLADRLFKVAQRHW